MIKKVLIANRSEIACRVIKTCKELGIKTVAIYSSADKNALHRQIADESYLLQGEKPGDTYLNMDKIISIAKSADCDAIHPGYGFLSENSEFNRKVRESGLIFIGPSPESMALLGSKTQSRITMEQANIPIIPGMRSSSDHIEDYLAFARKAEYPLLLKASAGGGGKGMRIVRSESELVPALEAARRESLSAFGSDEIFLEKYIEQPRHIEFQVAADKFGNAIHLFERECSIQRRHQKIIEETPSTALTQELRAKMGETAVKAILAANYENLATVEFLLDKNGSFYFLEVNARIQVEHPITEETTGLDLVKMQLEIASGEPLKYKQSDLRQTGHAIECRIYAEDSENNFMPSAGKIEYFKIPQGTGIRMDSGVQSGSNVSVFYDPILAKLIVKAENRETARLRMIEALRNTVTLGVKTSIAFMANCLEHNDFIEGQTYTDFIEKNSEQLFATKLNDNINYALIGSLLHNKSKSSKQTNSIGEIPSPWQTIGNWQICTQNVENE